MAGLLRESLIRFWRDLDKMNPQKVSVVIPCFNEEETLSTLFKKLERVDLLIDSEKYSLSFIFVDDGSTDNTLALLQERCNTNNYSQVVTREQNGGFGAALKSGLRAAGGDLVVTIDADTNYDQMEIPVILNELTSEYDIVTASPLHPDGSWNYPMHRFVTSRAVAQLYKLSLGRQYNNVYTFTSGFRVYRRKILESIMPQADDFLATAELLTNALMKEYRIKEYPTVVYDRMYGRSKLRTIATAISHLKLIMKLFFMRKN